MCKCLNQVQLRSKNLMPCLNYNYQARRYICCTCKIRTIHDVHVYMLVLYWLCVFFHQSNNYLINCMCLIFTVEFSNNGKINKHRQEKAFTVFFQINGPNNVNIKHTVCVYSTNGLIYIVTVHSFPKHTMSTTHVQLATYTVYCIEGDWHVCMMHV